ncbi:copper oxidase [Oleomonas cavernae]|uniref:Copper oxidase n=1 Tax=Oleomonas cavernae TaxID=2320859 RepID=A0A418WUQ0_9PROT|nr:multicopper oxidase domain-containing protein [Oleomonas cavernae]RJF94926.1 copper oxidase [Oleomonas cavernae]
MMTFLSRRRFLASSFIAGAGLLAPRLLHAATAAPATTLAVARRTIEVKGRAASVFGAHQADGTSGLFLDPGQRFAVRVDNRSGEDTILHWHGQTPPPDQDGVVDTGYARVVANGAMQDYDFAARPGTHWLHSHHGLQELQLLAAPLIVRTAEDLRHDAQEVVVLLHDFSFKEPAELLAGLGGGMNHGDMAGMDHSAMGHGTMDMPGMAMDLNDVEYDAYLANDRGLDDPQVVKVERGGQVRLRLINGASGTAFWIDLGALDGTVIAADGNPVQPVAGRRFPMAQGQRLDILLSLPAGDGGAFPILAQREGERQRTGIILATPGAAVVKLADLAEAAVPPVDLSLEQRLEAAAPLPQKLAEVTHRIALTGSMSPYRWTIDDRDWANRLPLKVTPGQRVAIEMVNKGMMAHPMHLHGHHFQVVGLNGKAVAGAVRDTVLVPIDGTVTIAFDADNSGRWLFHCHNLLHMATGMMTEVVYSDAV